MNKQEYTKFEKSAKKRLNEIDKEIKSLYYEKHKLENEMSENISESTEICTVCCKSSKIKEFIHIQYLRYNQIDEDYYVARSLVKCKICDNEQTKDYDKTVLSRMRRVEKIV